MMDFQQYATELNSSPAFIVAMTCFGTAAVIMLAICLERLYSEVARWQRAYRREVRWRVGR